MLPCLIPFIYVEAIFRALGFPRDIAAVAGTYAKYTVLWPVLNGLYQCAHFYFQDPRPHRSTSWLFGAPDAGRSGVRSMAPKPAAERALVKPLLVNLAGDEPDAPEGRPGKMLTIATSEGDVVDLGSDASPHANRRSPCK